MAAVNRKAAGGAALATPGRPRCELERWIDTYGEGATGAAYGRMNLRNVYANGQQVAGLDEAGKIDVLSRLTGFSNTDAGKTQVVAQAGDTLRSLAQRVYGNGNLWYLLAEANGLGDDPNGELVAGTSLTVPEAKTSSNDANTFKPYDPGEITGPTSPGLPYIEPPDKGCGTLGMIIMVIVAVVVTIYTAGALSGLVGAGMGTLTAGSAIAVGAIAGAAGAAASMAVGSAMGVASFSWRGVAAGAITGAITGGLASQFGSVGSAVNGTAATSTTAAVAPNLGKAVALSLANAGAGYAGQKLAGMDVSFSWRSIASSAVSSMVSAKVTPGIVDKFGLKTDFGYDFASGLTSGMVSAGVRSSFGQTLHRSDYMTVVADSFGNALGNALGRGQPSAPVEEVSADTGSAPSPFSLAPASTPAAAPGFGPFEPSQLRQFWDQGQGPSTAPASQRDSIRPAITPMYESEDRAVQWTDVPRLSRDTSIRNLTTGELVTQTPHLIVTPDEQRSNDFANLWNWSREYRFSAPSRADTNSLVAYRTRMDAATRPAWNQWAAQNQAYYRSQGIGVDLGREGVRLEGRNDWRDIKAMGTFIRGGIESSLNGVAMLAQMSPLGIGAYMARGEFWQPFEIEGPLEQAGEISFGVASLFVGGTPLFAGKAAPRLGAAGPLSRRINSWTDLGVPSASKGLNEVVNGVDDVVARRIQQLANEGHGVQRHGAQITPVQLERRAVEGLDPMTGTRVDGVHGGIHTPAQHATKVVTDEAYVFAETYARNSRQFLEATTNSVTGRVQLDIPLVDVYGPNFREYVYGVTRYGPKSSPLGFGDTQFSSNAYMVVRYKQDHAGAWIFNTMFPQP